MAWWDPRDDLASDIISSGGEDRGLPARWPWLARLIRRAGSIEEDKYFLVVSNNRRNRAFEQVLAVRLTVTKPRDSRPAMVELGSGEVMTGWASCDDIETVYDDEVRADMGAITAPTMRRVEAGLRAALGMAD
jgi:mRNA interferase MazF